MQSIEITKSGAVIELSQKELLVLRNVLNETLKGLDDWDFPIRTGFTLEEAEILLKALTAYYEKSKSDDI